jgi:hypothetical protein
MYPNAKAVYRAFPLQNFLFLLLGVTSVLNGAANVPHPLVRDSIENSESTVVMLSVP